MVLGGRQALGSCQRGFTLIELMVVLTVIAVLLSLSLASLTRSRSVAQSSVCMSSLRGLGQLSEVGTGLRRGRFPNGLTQGSTRADFAFHDLVISVFSPQGQATEYVVPFGLAGVIGPRDDPRPLSCPTVIRSKSIERASSEPRGDEPGLSYIYSVAFYTDPKLWAADTPSLRLTPEAYARDVRSDEIVFPDAKVMLSESRDYHGERTRLGSEQATSAQFVNAVFADGHAVRAAPRLARPALGLRWEWFPGDTQLRSVPFNAAVDGCRGRDY